MRSVICLLFLYGVGSALRAHNPPDVLEFLSESIANEGSQTGRPTGPLDPFLDKIKKTFTYLCSRCQTIVKDIDSAIDKEQLKNDAMKLCENVSKSEAMLDLCKRFVEDTLGALYKELKKLEPKPELCAHVRLCDSCTTNSTSSSTDIVSRMHDANPAFVIAKAAQLQAGLIRLAATDMLNGRKP
ncbi:hypothetical protein RB195_019507 [Necator americanus]|uniref:Saposin B-type domain-containing protein n=1 Tax=Necator americanus TaxID=51031 RepID=A0ABR1CGR9_NECAM